jgi:hypothetical protein
MFTLFLKLKSNLKLKGRILKSAKNDKKTIKNRKKIRGRT